MPRSTATPLCVTTTVPVGARDFDPYDLFRLAPPTLCPRFAWRAFDEATTYIGYGTEAGTGDSFVWGGASPIENTRRFVRDLATTCLDDERRTARGRARWFGGFAFDPLEPWGARWTDLAFLGTWFSLPEVQFAVRRGATRITALTWVQDEAALRTTLATLAEKVIQLSKARASQAPRAVDRAARPASDGQPARRGPIDAAGAVGAERPIDPILAGRLSRALAAIDAGTVQKVVVATSRTVPCDIAHGDMPALAGAVASAAPGCTAYLVAPPANDVEAVWLGATPERLVRVRGHRLWTMALAGTARRGATTAEDRALGAALLASDKDRREHAAVVDAVRGVLAHVPGLDITVAPEPRLRRLATMQHLETPITARSTSRLDVLDIAHRLHPTPALAGWPRAAALDLIARIEPDGRGWYGGGVGWLDGTGDGDIAVGIRGLLIREGAATAYAGAGIVAGSDAAAEAREIELKLAAAFAPLQAWASSSASLSASLSARLSASSSTSAQESDGVR
ncbi:MAG: isochorismate synthase [Ardenticatenales bacterium]|nr:isochorismate synthase [Ardenticatenales bacterium]